MKPGDIVRLKSGGPTMTIEQTDGVLPPNVCYCLWFNKHHEIQRQMFHKSVLEKESQ